MQAILPLPALTPLISQLLLLAAHLLPHRRVATNWKPTVIGSSSKIKYTIKARAYQEAERVGVNLLRFLQYLSSYEHY